MKKIIIFIILLAIGGSVYSYSLADSNVPNQNFVYLFHLYYDSGKLLADRDFQFKYDLVADRFTPETIKTSKPYSFKIIGVNNKLLASNQFDPQKGNPKFLKGKISVKGPYFADAARVDFYDSGQQLLLTLDLGASSFCNDDGRCDSSIGENSTNCPNDCRLAVTPSPSVITPTTGSSGQLLVILGIVLVILIVIFIVWFIIKRRKGGDLPPTQ